MCGLLLSIRLVQSGQDGSDPLFDSLLVTVKARGPDSLGIHTSRVDLEDGNVIEVKLAASVLGLRGDGITKQPLEDAHGVLGWNGQVFQGLSVGLEENDTAKLFERLSNGAQPRKLLNSIEGPYASVYLDKTTNILSFQIDPLSRRSLLIHPPHLTETTDRLIICSARSGDAESTKLEMRAMDGGEGGSIGLNGIRIKDGRMSFGDAFQPYLSSKDSRPWTHVASINPTLPQGDLASPSTEVSTFIEKLTTSVRLRVENIPSLEPGQSRLAILFSGGVDCTLLAAIAHRCLPLTEPIDLINVGFQRSPDSPNNESEYKVPDRISGIEATEELRSCCPGRTWRFVEVNVAFEQSMGHRQKILDLMYPSTTEMDLSLAWPLYFASLGEGIAQTATGGEKVPYKVTAKVYLSGLGADEQLAGYKRHQTAFQRGSWSSLIEELQLDIQRLPTRNLSRDDRILSSHARDARFPYLDLDFIQYLSSLPVWSKTDPTFIGGDKLLLRLAAKQLGLIKTGDRVKRAMQFGTRSAKVGGKGKGAKKGDLPVQVFDA